VTRDERNVSLTVISEHLVSLRRAVKQNVHVLDGKSQDRLRKLANAAESAMSARDLLFQESSELFQQNNESNVRASTKSIVVGKERVLSFEDTVEARRKREEKDASEKRRRGRKRTDSASTPAHSRGQKSREKEVEEANCEIDALGTGKYCSVFSV
jgi:hypothetical protein